jgi:hypothetical protein
MRKIATFIAAGAALAAAPAAAQLVGGNVGANVGVGVGVDTGRTVGNVLDTTDRIATRAVDRTQNLAARTINGTRVQLVTRTDVRTGAEVRDSRGQRIGTVHHLDGNAAVVVQGNNAYHVPLAQLYRTTSGKARHLVTAIPRAQLTGHANAHASANSAVSAGHRH